MCVGWHWPRPGNTSWSSPDVSTFSSPALRRTNALCRIASMSVRVHTWHVQISEGGGFLVWAERTTSSLRSMRYQKNENIHGAPEFHRSNEGGWSISRGPPGPAIYNPPRWQVNSSFAPSGLPVTMCEVVKTQKSRVPTAKRGAAYASERSSCHVPSSSPCIIQRRLFFEFSPVRTNRQDGEL